MASQPQLEILHFMSHTIFSVIYHEPKRATECLATSENPAKFKSHSITEKVIQLVKSTVSNLNC